MIFFARNKWVIQSIESILPEAVAKKTENKIANMKRGVL